MFRKKNKKKNINLNKNKFKPKKISLQEGLTDLKFEENDEISDPLKIQNVQKEKNSDFLPEIENGQKIETNSLQKNNLIKKEENLYKNIPENQKDDVKN